MGLYWGSDFSGKLLYRWGTFAGAGDRITIHELNALLRLLLCIPACSAWTSDAKERAKTKPKKRERIKRGGIKPWPAVDADVLQGLQHL